MGGVATVERALSQLSGPAREQVVSTMTRYENGYKRLKDEREEAQSIPGQMIEDVQYMAGAALRGSLERAAEYFDVLEWVSPALPFVGGPVWGASAAFGIRPASRMMTGFMAPDVRTVFAGQKANKVTARSLFIEEFKLLPPPASSPSSAPEKEKAAAAA